MSQPEPRPAMTMRQIREGLGHVKPGTPEATALPTTYVVSCLPEGHDARLAYTITVQYRGDGLYAIVRNLKFWGADGAWEYEPNWDEDGGEAEAQAEEAWLAAHRFGHDEALRLARKVAPTLTYRGLTVADVLDDEWGAAPAENTAPAPSAAPLAASQPSEAPVEPDTATRASTGRTGDSRRTLTSNEYDAAWHAVEGAAGEEGADPGTVLHAVLNRLGIDWQDAASTV